ncbi:MAG: class I SAM-dependent methyltransferase [Bacteriovoracales bacterium]|nr:class I SAM-dependent methyltransferase [Bacteriovoracales bacterium]
MMTAHDLQHIEKLTDAIEGWFSAEEGRAFYHIAKSCSDGSAIVEIGSWQGKSTVWIAKGIKASQKEIKFYAIDPHIGSKEHQKGEKVWTFEKFKENMAKASVEDVVTPLVKYSDDALKDVERGIDFLFIDGAHDYESVKNDFVGWFPKVNDGGMIAFHDSTWPGVKRVLTEMVYPHEFVTQAKMVQGTTIVTKSGQKANFTQRLQKRLRSFQFQLFRK